MQLRQQDVAHRTVGAQDENGLQRRQVLLMPLLTRHVPHPADVTVPVEHQDAVCAKANPRVAQGRSPSRGVDRQLREERDQSEEKRTHIRSWHRRWRVLVSEYGGFAALDMNRTNPILEQVELRVPRGASAMSENSDERHFPNRIPSRQ